MDYFILIIVGMAVAAWWLKFRSSLKATSASFDTETSTLSEHELAQLQKDFENRLKNDADLPDGIRGRDAYIYWNLMRNWYEKLIAENRYDDEYAKKLRSDWRDYIQLLPRAKSAQFLANQINDEARIATYEREVESAFRSIELIQNAFATAIGVEATEELQEVREKSPNAFDRSGLKPMAVVGYYYCPVSLNPYMEECRLIKANTASLV